MTEDVIQSMSINKILISILEEKGSIKVPTHRFMDAGTEEKELVVEYDEDSLSFTFSLREKTNE